MERLLVIQLKLKEYAIEVCIILRFQISFKYLKLFPRYICKHTHRVTHPSPLKNHIFFIMKYLKSQKRECNECIYTHMCIYSIISDSYCMHTLIQYSQITPQSCTNLSSHLTNMRNSISPYLPLILVLSNF